MVVVPNATKGQPPQRIQRGIAQPRPYLLANSASAPSGHSTPHQTRPSITIESNTHGHQMPQNTNCAASVRLFQRCEVSSGSGMTAGTRIRNAYTATTPH